MSVPDLGTNAMCFPQLLTGRPVFLVNLSGREGGQSHAGASSGGLAAVPSSASPAADCGTHPPPWGATNLNRKKTDPGGSPAMPAVTPPAPQVTTPNPPSPVDLQKRKQNTHTTNHQPRAFPGIR